MAASSWKSLSKSTNCVVLRRTAARSSSSSMCPISSSALLAPVASRATKLKLLMNAKDGLLLICSAGCLSSHGKPVRRSRRHSRMWTPGWPGKISAVVCNVRCSGDVNTAVGHGSPVLPSAVRLSISIFARNACNLPSAESSASSNWPFCNTDRLAASNRSLKALLDGECPSDDASEAARDFAFASSMLCTASPCLTKNKVFLTSGGSALLLWASGSAGIHRLMAGPGKACCKALDNPWHIREGYAN
mmetsp:Transcript_96018/g.248784  ORF Transcript_96018/g.248784 Transcript_96018/m.248784 type:complete len:247 (+) Transcript_96018:371-1111(+)